MQKLLVAIGAVAALCICSCGKSIEQRASDALNAAAKEVTDGQPYEIKDKEVVFKTDSDCVTYFTFHYQGQDEALEHLYSIFSDSTILESIGKREILQESEKSYREMRDKRPVSEREKMISLTRWTSVQIKIHCLIAGHIIEDNRSKNK